MKIEIRLQDLVLYILLGIFVLIACIKYVETKAELKSLNAVNYKAIIDRVNENTKDIAAIIQAMNKEKKDGGKQ